MLSCYRVIVLLCHRVIMSLHFTWCDLLHDPHAWRGCVVLHCYPQQIRSAACVARPRRRWCNPDLRHCALLLFFSDDFISLSIISEMACWSTGARRSTVGRLQARSASSSRWTRTCTTSPRLKLGLAASLSAPTGKIWRLPLGISRCIQSATY